jgi:group I intron endonuclease
MLIYKITNTVNGRIYVGKTELTMEERWKVHLRDAKKVKRPLYAAMRKYGIDKFVTDIIELCEGLDELNARERYWIATLKSTLPDGNYNIGDGGEGGYVIRNWPEEHKRKLWDQQAKTRTGQPRSDIAKQHMSEAAKVREAKKTDEAKQEIATKLSEAMKAQYASGQRVVTAPKRFGSDHPGWVDIDIPAVLLMIQDGTTLTDIAKHYAVNTVTISERLKQHTSKTFIEWKREYGTKRKPNPAPAN